MCSKPRSNVANEHEGSTGDRLEPTKPLEAQRAPQPPKDLESRTYLKRWTGPDCAWSWVIAIACSMLNFFTLALLRSGSVLFLNSIEYYEASRAAASWPPSLIIAVSNLSGIVTGYLTKRFGPRRVALVGSVISSSSIMACYFATNITRLTILCGICHGVGMGLNVPAVAVCLNLWFRERKVIASGIIYTGAAFGSFVYPIFFEWLIDKVGFRGSFLVLGAIMAHGFAAALFIRTPPWMNIDGSSRCPSKQSSRRPSATVSEKNAEPITAKAEPAAPTISSIPPQPVLRRKPLIPRSVSQNSFDSVESREESTEQKAFQKMRPTVQRIQIVEPVLEEGDGGESSATQPQSKGHETTKREGDRVKDETEQTHRAPSPTHLQELDCCTQHDDHCPAAVLRRPDIARVLTSVANASGSNASGGSGVVSTSAGGSSARTSVHSGHRYKLRRSSSTISTTISLYAPAVAVSQTAERDFEVKAAKVTFEEPEPARMNRLIILVSITYIVLINCNHAFQTILLDFAADKDVEVHEAVYLLSGFAVFDIAGRLLVGVISDLGLLTRPALIGSACILFGITTQLLPFARGFIMLLSYAALIGFSLGTSVVLITVLVGDYVADLTQIPLAIGWMAFFSGITGLTRPLIIGFFRDTSGNYDGMLHLMGALMLTCGVSWIVVTLYEKHCQTDETVEPPAETPSLPSENTTKSTKVANDQTIEESVGTVTKL